MSRTRPRIGTTSFVFPAGWLENVRRLAGRVDDVQILVFEDPDRGPSPDEIEAVAALGRVHGLTFSVHAPLELRLADADPARRAAGVDAVLRTAALTEPLAPHALVVHLDPPPRDGAAGQAAEAWRGGARASLLALIEAGLVPGLLCLENLDGGFGPAEPLLDELGLSAALDLGHLARDGIAFDELLARHLRRARLIHWHGTERLAGEGRDPGPRLPPLAPGQAHPPAPPLARGRDHRSLRHYPRQDALRLLRALARAGWDGVLTLEVFREDDLESSLEALAGWWREVGGTWEDRWRSHC